MSRYPHINFCKDPGAICGKEYPELKWIGTPCEIIHFFLDMIMRETNTQTLFFATQILAGLFYWTRSLQTYDDGWNYLDNLKSFVKGGLKDDSFIDAVSGIVNRVSKIFLKSERWIITTY